MLNLMRVCLLALLLQSFTYFADSHLCMWQPQQRMPADISGPGMNVCYQKEGPCGEHTPNTPGNVSTTLIAGQEFAILLQQNLNHFYRDAPGKIVADFAAIGSPSESDFTVIGSSINDYPAMNMITQTNFTIKVKIPEAPCNQCVLRVRYMSQNPTENDRGTTFYQCADVNIVKSTTETTTSTASNVAVVTKTEASDSAASHDCCAAKQFTMSGYETSNWRNPTHKKYYFDGVNKLFRIDEISGNGVTPKDGSFQMYNNFTSGIEYYYNTVTGTCELYGLNIWMDWCYGSINSQVLSSSITIGNQIADVWKLNSDNNIFTWTNTRDTCVPVGNSRLDTGENTLFYNYIPSTSPSAKVSEDHTLPAACVKKHQSMLAANENALRNLPASPRAKM